jgi:hypothetical protein
MRGFLALGSAKELPIRTELHAVIPDLNAFLADPRRRVGISGSLWFPEAANKREVEYKANGSLDLLKRVQSTEAIRGIFREVLDDLSRTTTPTHRQVLDPVGVEDILQRLERETRRYEMDYDLELTEVGGGRSWSFAGVKHIVGGPAATAAWTETTTMTFSLAGPPRAPRGCGTLHVHMADLLGKQIPSFNITGTEDDVRIAWGFGRFFRFFFGVLRRVYLPTSHLPGPFGDPERT